MEGISKPLYSGYFLEAKGQKLNAKSKAKIHTGNVGSTELAQPIKNGCKGSVFFRVGETGANVKK
jgi:hypothetical protein